MVDIFYELSSDCLVWFFFSFSMSLFKDRISFVETEFVRYNAY